MYIGPWQEYKLAQVIKLKNDLYQGSLAKRPKLSTKNLQLHNQQFELNSQTKSTSSKRSYSSEPMQRRYPTFDLNTYYSQWKKVQTIVARSEYGSQPKKPPLPKPNIRRRVPKNYQVQRIEKMRKLYGIQNERSETTLPSSQANTARERQELPPLQKSNSMNRNRRSDLEGGQRQEGIREVFVDKPLVGLEKKVGEEQKSCSQRIGESMQKERGKKEQVNSEIDKRLIKFSSFGEEVKKSSEEEISEDEMGDPVDGLLKWVEELPEELSISDVIKKNIVIQQHRFVLEN